MQMAQFGIAGRHNLWAILEGATEGAMKDDGQRHAGSIAVPVCNGRINAPTLLQA